MRLEWLEDILAIAETGSFSGAAERRRLTQSAFSRRIRQIEDYVGVELFDRDHKPIRLQATTLAQSEQILTLVSGLRQLLVDLRRGERMTSNKVVIACQHSLTAMRIPSILQQLPIQHDTMQVRLRSANLDECTGLLLSRQADVAIVYQLPEESGDFNADFLEIITIGTDRLIPVFNRPFAQIAVDGPDIPYIAYPPDVFFGRVMARRILPFLDADIHFTPKVETALTLAAVEMAVAGVGVAWVPNSLAQSRIATGQLVQLSADLPACNLQITAMRLEGNPNAAGTALWTQLLML
ncbi:LysR family transcriptional regulator [Cypionkella aquatica]|uniref:LysR family transcriptional regulator n=1 Tax=Cypionkella aquatica TaxID=1756042 RepID=A0AA37X1H2_9RHOB|nr:LysR family transcriptional regulator [Cypionkella aquatica]GLS87439.1 LysR family transcriptional regulator [Cypionkella aquatica]